VKPVNDVTVKTVLKSFLARVRKEGRWTAPAPATRPQRAPVEDVTTQVHSQCCGSGSARIHIILVTWIRIRIKIHKLNPDPHQFADVKPKCMKYEPF
jgi:hypothetical protein